MSGFATRASANDIVTTFDISGTAGSGFSATTLGGSINIDVTTGTIVSADVMSSNPNETLTTVGNGSSFFDYFVDISKGGSSLDLIFPSASLVGYSGASPCTDSNNNCGFFGVSTFDGLNVNSLTLTDPPPPSAPEPSTYVMLGLGLIGLAMLRKVRGAVAEA